MNPLKKANELLEDALKRIDMNGKGILKASTDAAADEKDETDARSRIAVKWEAMKAACEDLRYALDELHWRLELGGLIHPEEYGERAFCSIHTDPLSTSFTRELTEEERRTTHPKCEHLHLTGPDWGLQCMRTPQFVGIKKSAKELIETTQEKPSCCVPR